MFSGSYAKKPHPMITPSKASKTHPKVFNMLHPNVVTLHNHQPTETLSLRAKNTEELTVWA